MMTLHKNLIVGLLSVLGTFAPWAMAQNTIDMNGKTALITGSTSGLGEVVARRLGAMGATVIVHGLNEQRGQEIAAEITKKGPGKAVYLPRRSRLAERSRCARKTCAGRAPEAAIPLINNAGIYGGPNDARRESTDGHELDLRRSLSR